MSESQETDSGHASQGGEGSADQLVASIQGHKISQSAIESAYRFLQAIALYTKISMDRQMAQSQVRTHETFIKSNPAQRTTRGVLLADARTKLGQAEAQESRVKAVVGVRLAEIVANCVQQELGQATAEIVRQTEARCREEAKQEIESIKATYQEQIRTIEQAAVEAARAEVAKGMAAFEQSRLTAATLQVAEPAPDATTSASVQDLATLRQAHNDLAERFTHLAQKSVTGGLGRTSFAQMTAAEDGSEQSTVSNATVLEALSQLNHRMQGLERRLGKTEDLEVRMEDVEHLDSRRVEESVSNGSSERSTSKSGTRNETADAPTKKQALDSHRLRLFWQNPSPAKLAALSPVEADLILLSARVRQMDREIEWLNEQQAETWALVQLGHVAWGSTQLLTREFVRQSLDVVDTIPS